LDLGVAPADMNPHHQRDLKDRNDAAMYHKHLAKRFNVAARWHDERAQGIC
jgi:RNase H-fold protein (predicted Holliday junction resolvase)